MIIAGKCPPEPEELEYAKGRGFDYVELYLEKRHVNDLEGSIRAVEESEVEAVSIHTPHSTLDEKEDFEKAGDMAEELDAFLVFHSQYLHHVHIPKLEGLDISCEYGYENNPGVSKRLLEALILENGHELVLDTAHFFMAEENYMQETEELLESYGEQIPVIHLCDSSRQKDGLAFGEGEMDMESLCRVIEGSDFDGILVLEVMPDHQEDALARWNEYAV